MNVWPSGYHLVLRDDVLDFEVPLNVIVDQPLSFDPADGMRLGEEQAKEILAKICTEGCDAAISVGDTFGVLREYLGTLMLRGAGAGDKEEARRLGRVIAIASYFDAGVGHWLQHWTGVLSEAEGFLGREDDRGSAGGVEEPGPSGADDTTLTANDIARSVKALLDPDLALVIRSVKGAERHAEVASLGALHYLNLSQACRVLNTSDATLRQHGFLNDLHENPLDQSKLNGHKVGSGARATWRFSRNEVERFGPILRSQGR